MDVVLVPRHTTPVVWYCTWSECATKVFLAALCHASAGSGRHLVDCVPTSGLWGSCACSIHGGVSTTGWRVEVERTLRPPAGLRVFEHHMCVESWPIRAVQASPNRSSACQLVVVLQCKSQCGLHLLRGSVSGTGGRTMCHVAWCGIAWNLRTPAGNLSTPCRQACTCEHLLYMRLEAMQDTSTLLVKMSVLLLASVRAPLARLASARSVQCTPRCAELDMPLQPTGLQRHVMHMLRACVGVQPAILRSLDGCVHDVTSIAPCLSVASYWANQSMLCHN